MAKQSCNNSRRRADGVKRVVMLSRWTSYLGNVHECRYGCMYVVVDGAA
jgi:hypothetical protein